MSRYILASSSPRRKELFLRVVSDFEIIPADIDESEIMHSSKNPREIAIFLASKKALHISSLYPDAKVIGADTLVSLEGDILGKPRDFEEGVEMLLHQSGKTEEVITAVALAEGNILKKSIVEVSEVFFREISRNEAKEYVRVRKPFDKAGGYGIQDPEFDFINSYTGSITTIIGFPVEKVREMLGLMCAF